MTRCTTNWGSFESRNTNTRNGKNPFPKAEYLVGKQADENQAACLSALEKVRAEIAAKKAMQAS